jgi:hypothetical protein
MSTRVFRLSPQGLVPIALLGRTSDRPTYSIGANKRWSQLGDGVSRAEHRMVLAVQEGVSAWREARNKSAQKSVDGWYKNQHQSAAKGLGRFIRHASWAPRELTRRVYPGRDPRQQLLAHVLLPIYR